MDGCETGILIDFSEPTDISLDGMETFRTLNSANNKNRSDFDEEQKENVYNIEDSKELERSGSEKQNSFTQKTPHKEKNGVLGDVTDFVTNLKSPVQDVQNSPTVTRLIDEETFDFDLPLTPTQHEISQEVPQFDNEEEVFFGPVSFTERCVRTVVGNINPLTEEVKPLSPLRPEQWAELVKEANIVAFRLQEGQTSSSDDNMSPVQHVNKTGKRNLGYSECKTNGNKNCIDSKQDKIANPGLMSPRNGHRRSDTFIVNTENLPNDIIKVLPVIKTPTESFNSEMLTKRREEVNVKQDKLSESKCSARDASVEQEKRSSNERLSAAEQITNKPGPGSKLSRLPRNRSATSLQKPRVEAVANNSEIKTSRLSQPKSNDAVSSKTGGTLIPQNGTKENNDTSTTGDRKTSASRGLVRSGSLRVPSNGSTEIPKKEDRKSGSTGLTRKGSLRVPSKASSFTRKSVGESQTNINDTDSKVGPAAVATKTLRSSGANQVTAQGTALGNTTNESMFLKQNVQKTGIPAPKTKLHLYKPGTVQNALILNRSKQGDNVTKCNGPMKALVPVSEKQTALKPAGRSYSDSSVSCTPMKTEKHVQPKCLLSSSFITPNKGSTSSTDSSTPASGVNKRSMLPTPTKIRLGSASSIPHSPMSIRSTSSVSSTHSRMSYLSDSSTASPVFDVGLSTKNLGSEKYSHTDFIDDSSPSVMKPRKPLVMNTPNMPKKEQSVWSPIKKEKLVLEDQVIQCTKRTSFIKKK